MTRVLPTVHSNNRHETWLKAIASSEAVAGSGRAKRRRRTQRPPDRSEAKGGMPHRGCPNESEDWGWTGLWLKAIASSEAVAGSGRSAAKA